MCDAEMLFSDEVLAEWKELVEDVVPKFMYYELDVRGPYLDLSLFFCDLVTGMTLDIAYEDSMPKEALQTWASNTISSNLLTLDEKLSKDARKLLSWCKGEYKGYAREIQYDLRHLTYYVNDIEYKKNISICILRSGMISYAYLPEIDQLCLGFKWKSVPTEITGVIVEPIKENR